MRSKSLTTMLAYGVLSLVAGVILCLPKSLPVAVGAPMAGGADTINVPGVVRDFRKDDTGFVDAGYGGTHGHVAGNIGLALDTDGRPAFTGGGFDVDDQWRTEDLEPIAPHLFASGDSGVVKVVNAPTINNNPVIDTWDSAQGPYGGANKGPAPAWETGSTMPSVSAPSPLPQFISDIVYQGNATSTLSVNRYCKTFVLQNNHTLQISGDIYIYATEKFTVENHTRVLMLPGASLTVYVAKDFEIQNNTQVNMNTWDPARFTVINLGTKEMNLHNSGEVCGTIIAPNAPLHVKNSHQFYGSFTGKSVQLANSAGFHINASTPRDFCDVILNDIEGAAGGSSTGGIASETAFAGWYREVLGRNLSASHDIVLTRNGSGIYEYLDDAFFPIDGRLFGNEGMNHNYYFTFMFSVEFVHHACDDRFLQFQGADDTWAFVDGDLALDLGGILPGTDQYIEFDRLGLTDGETYRLRFFYAQRNPSVATFRLRTNLDLVKPDYSASASPTFD